MGLLKYHIIGMIDLGYTLNRAEKNERRDAAENRQLLLATASKLFAQHGAEAVCMSEIAKAAGVGKGTLYRRFSSKGELCLALLDCELRQFQDKVIQSFQKQIQDGVSTNLRLAWFIKQAVGFTANYLPLMVEISHAGSENTVQDINQPHFWMEMTVKGHLQRLIKDGDITPETDIDYVTSALLAPLDARIMKVHINQRGYSKEQICRGIQKLIDGLQS